MNAVQFDVAYHLREYREFVLEHACHVKGKPLGFIGQTALSLFAIPVFLLKASKVGPCSFILDVAGIVRTSKHGKMRMPWTEVTAIHRYTPGLLIEKRGGAVPIPYRCLTSSQREAVESLLRHWEAEHPKETGHV